MSVIQKIANQSYKVFCSNNRGYLESDHLKPLVDLMKKLTANDLNIDLNLLRDQTPHNFNSKKAPVTYIKIWDDRYFSMGVFVLRPGTRLPLHDHPHMHGLIKVLYGSCLINSFSVDNGNKSKVMEKEETVLRVIERTEAIANHASEPVVLTPSTWNCHEIKTTSGVAFFDILSPPYDDEQHQCNYYETCSSIGDCNPHLHRISPPSDYWTDQDHYKGPPIDKEMVYNSD